MITLLVMAPNTFSLSLSHSLEVLLVKVFLSHKFHNYSLRGAIFLRYWEVSTGSDWMSNNFYTREKELRVKKTWKYYLYPGILFEDIIIIIIFSLSISIVQE